ncbi:hypothetical protein LY474_11640 [Myxococcus stipitatus]|uniref:hypothetical protein n=1 Tax=Myxococcus stipitatus TaxID=83455 RepID=UPI001F24C535|nr:hypothetical protein [Myxococcus stipitatus]MCE9668464.1 hypothetical protein [Myxococcus stipitatus]
MVESLVSDTYLETINAARIAAGQGVDMKAADGFRATMTALPGRGTEEWTTKETHAENFAGPRAQALGAEVVS